MQDEGGKMKLQIYKVACNTGDWGGISRKFVIATSKEEAIEKAFEKKRNDNDYWAINIEEEFNNEYEITVTKKEM